MVRIDIAKVANALSGDDLGTLATAIRQVGNHVDTLRDRIRLLEAVIENFPGGISLFDGKLQMVLCNEQQKLLLDYPDDLFADGFPTLEDLFRFNALRGEYGPGDVGGADGPAHGAGTRAKGACLRADAAERHSARGARHADRRRRLRHHLSRRHRAAAQPGADRAHGASRHADQPAQPGAVHRPAADGDRARKAVGADRGPLSRHRQVQAGQRYARPPGRRCAADRNRQSPQPHGARKRHGRPPRRRRVCDRPDRHRERRRCRGAGAPRAGPACRARSRSLGHDGAGRRLDRNSAVAGGRHHDRRDPDQGRRGALSQQDKRAVAASVSTTVPKTSPQPSRPALPAAWSPAGRS